MGRGWWPPLHARGALRGFATVQLRTSASANDSVADGKPRGGTEWCTATSRRPIFSRRVELIRADHPEALE
jgi:hypothetical protein